MPNCDELVKYECSQCGKQFIVSGVNSQSKVLNCPYPGCGSECEAVVWSNPDNQELLNELGCLGIYTIRE